MSLEAPFADFHALAKCSQDSAIAKLSRDSALPPVLKHPSDCQQLNCWTTEKERNMSAAFGAGGCDSINFRKPCFSAAVMGIEICH